MTAPTRSAAPRSRLTRPQRKALLVAHIALSVAWLGTALVMLTLAITARTTASRTNANSAYWAMHLLVQVLVTPLSLTILVIGISLAAGTSWGLLRYRWVVTKLSLTIVAVGLSVLALPAQTGSALRASEPGGDLIAMHSAGTYLIIAASVSISLYLTLTTVSVFKPWGRTARGSRPAA
jgi:hypothetical protein